MITIALRTALLTLPLFAFSAFAQVPTASPAATANAPAVASGVRPASTSTHPSGADMMKIMTEMAKLNDNHKLLGQLAGEWTYTGKMWMAPNAPPMEFKGTATRKPEMGGRYMVSDTHSKFPMPGPDGKMQQFDFEGRLTEAYDNAKQKFVSTWFDNMGTGIMVSEGTYDPASATFTYTGEYEMAPGMKQNTRETVKVTDKDHHTMAWFENRGGQEVKTMEIAYTRTK